MDLDRISVETSGSFPYPILGRTPASLEEQALRPIENPSEMGGELTEVVNRLSEDADSRH